MKALRWIVTLAAILVLTGCAALRPDFETPTVSVRAVRPLPSESIMPRFEIDLHVVNPNHTPLELQGIAYRLMLEGHEILTGVANDLPIIDGYGEGDITLTAAANLIGSIQFLAELVSGRHPEINYLLDAKLDLGAFHPILHLREKGKVQLDRQSPGKSD